MAETNADYVRLHEVGTSYTSTTCTLVRRTSTGEKRWECACGSHGGWSLFADHVGNAVAHLKRTHIDSEAGQ